ncbi:hypothetical protein P7K49_025243 [Saguinus oedipus]|uniref:Uncharacterized protein n=1 Tax=Saguinus oedipus TaxID=9490 RepID=A0ABQ9UGJ0_SAGOE|nr:hypothetical protein P7K49_025243 [Saguinus oedipus]
MKTLGNWGAERMWAQEEKGRFGLGHAEVSSNIKVLSSLMLLVPDSGDGTGCMEERHNKAESGAKEEVPEKEIPK